MIAPLKHRWRLIRWEYRARKNGRSYHHHCWEIIVSKKELLIQLSESWQQDNLLRLLVFGKEQQDYEKLLLLVSLKFEFLGSRVHPVGNTRRGKPPLKSYIQILFEGGYGTLEEVEDRIARLTGNVVTDVFARQIFRKLLFVSYTCCPCMAETSEIWWADTYRCFLEYAVENNCFPYPGGQFPKCIWDAMPKGLLHCHQKRDFVLAHIPQELRLRIIHAPVNTVEVIRW